MKIEQAAVNDIYMLFATNVANVVISSTQTIVVLLGQERAARLASAAATRIQSASLLKHFTITGLSIKQLTLMNLTTKIGIAMTQSWTASIKAATIAMAQFTRSNGVLIGITAAAVGLLAAYETNFLGLKDAIDGLLGTEAEHISLLEEQRNAAKALEESNNSMANSFEFRIPKSLSVATIELAKHRQEYERLIEKQKESAELAQKVSVPVPTGGPKTVAQLIQERDFRDARKGGTFFGIKLPEFFPQADAAEQNYMPQFALQGKDELELRRLAIDFLSEFVSSPQFREQIFRQQHTVSSLSKEYNTDPRLNQLIPDLGLDPASIEFQDKLAAQKAGLSLKEYQLRKVFTVVDIPGAEFTGRSLFRGQGMEALKGKIVNGVPIGNVLRGRLMVAQRRAAEAPFTQDPEEFADITDPEDELTQVQYARLLAAQKGVGGSIVLTAKEKRIFDKIGRGEIKGNRAEVLIRTGEDIGAAANNYSLEDAMRIGVLQESQRQFNRTSADPFVSDFYKLSPIKKFQALTNNAFDRVQHKFGVAARGITNTRTFSDVLRSSSLETQRASVYNIAGIGGRAGAAIAAVGGNATAAFQVPRGSIGTPSHIKLAIVRKDSFNNSLGGLMMNELNSLKGTGQMVYSSAHRSIFKDRNFKGVPGKTAFRKAISLGIKGNSEYMAAIRAIPDVNRESEDNMRQAHQAIRQAESIANDYIAMVTTNMGAIGFSDIIFQRAITEGRSTQSIYRDVGLLAASRRTNFDNVEIINKASSKLGLTNSQIFDIRFNSNRGDVELEDRLRWLDRRESMSTGASVL